MGRRWRKLVKRLRKLQTRVPRPNCRLSTDPSPSSLPSQEAYNKMLEDVAQDGQRVDKIAIFLEANGGVNKKCRSWGFGASVKYHNSTSSSTTSSCKSKFTPHPTVEDNELKTRLHVIEEENDHLKSKINVMEDQLASVLNMLQQFTGAKVVSSSRPPNDGDDRVLSNENDGEDLGNDD